MQKCETWGWNEFHEPEICEYCDFDNCDVCDNGPNKKRINHAKRRWRVIK